MSQELVDRDVPASPRFLDQEDQRNQTQTHNRENAEIVDVGEHGRLTLHARLQQAVGLLHRTRAAVIAQRSAGAMKHPLKLRICRIEMRREAILMELCP